MHTTVYAYNLKFKFKLIFVIIFSFIFSIAAQSANENNVGFPRTQTTYQSSTNYHPLQKTSFCHTHASCATHGHGHCCTHIINDAPYLSVSQIQINRKDSCLPKNLLPIEFIQNFFKPPISI